MINGNSMYQVSTINALLEGVHEGVITIDELLKHGNFGIGTFESIDGELIIHQGIAYQANGDGSLTEAPKDLKTPFAMISSFHPENRQPCNSISSMKALGEYLVKQFVSKNYIYAILIEDCFSKIKARSLLPQKVPYKPLYEILDTVQNTFELENITGSLVGFYFPEYFKNINMPHFHFHFINEEKTLGGHVFEIEIKTAHLQISQLSKFELLFPEHSHFSNTDLLSENNNIPILLQDANKSG